MPTMAIRLQKRACVPWNELCLKWHSFTDSLLPLLFSLPQAIMDPKLGPGNKLISESAVAGEAMTTTRKQYSPKFKARVAIEAIRGERTLNQLATQFRVYPVQIAHW